MEGTIEIANDYSTLQKRICKIIEQADGRETFKPNNWQNELGYGTTSVMENGLLIEKAGVNFSSVSGIMSEELKKTLQISEKETLKYTATGISSIIHSSNPYIPTIHFNVRFFGLSNGHSWFGGGIDLTPAYIDLVEARNFHAQLKSICNKYDPEYYTRFKQWADEYFYLPHRNETRGIGGIFFDRLVPFSANESNRFLGFTKELAKAYPEIYAEILNNKREKQYSEHNKTWQKIRRGRYVEFNLLYDRGTRFGIETRGKTESILVSLPSEVIWKYDYQPAGGTEENNTLKFLRKGIDWLTIKK
jgi:coproporphyrinogen III oxidase